MINLLTGKNESRAHVDATPTATIDEPWTAERHLTVMRQLLHSATNSNNAEHLLKAARVHAEAAKTAGRTPLPVKTAPARTLPRDGDTV